MKENIIKYLQGTASEKEKKELLAWLKENEENKASFSEIRDAWLQTNDHPSVSGADYSQKAFNLFLNKAKQPEQKVSVLSLRSLFKVAASIAILCLCTWSGYLIGEKNNAQLPDPVVVNQLVMGKESKGSVVLPDGSTAWLNANSRLTYPEQFAANDRRVKLEGEGYFEVKKDIRKPFYVETEGMTINVLGTRFDVQNYKEKATFNTALLSGKVEIQFPDRQERITLAPNQKITRNRETGEYLLSEVNASDYILWINDKLTCTNEKLETILHKLKYWYGLDMVYGKNISMQQRLSLTVRKETPEELFKLLELICPIRCTVTNNTVYIDTK